MERYDAEWWRTQACWRIHRGLDWLAEKTCLRIIEPLADRVYLGWVSRVYDTTTDFSRELAERERIRRGRPIERPKP